MRESKQNAKRIVEMASSSSMCVRDYHRLKETTNQNINAPKWQQLDFAFYERCWSMAHLLQHEKVFPRIT
jgi:hypothetical protein